MSDSDKTAALIQLAGAIAHELNNIFTAVAGNLSLLEDSMDKSTTNAEMIGDVVRTARRGIALSEKLQAFAGRQPLKRRHVDVASVAREFAAELKATLPRSVRFEFVPTEEPCTAYVDEAKLRDCMREFAINAVAAMDNAGILKMEIDSRRFASGEAREIRSGAYVAIRMTDSGRGMGPEIAARALDPMFSTRGSSVNFGWGLSSCAGFLRQSGGALRVHSKPGCGTTVEAYLPIDPLASSSRHRTEQQNGTRNVA